jgi:hypothetical protein
MRQEKLETTETKTKDNQAQKLRANQSLTPEQRAIVNRVMAETAEWEPIGEESMNDFSLSISPLDLKHNFPEAWKEQNEKRYAFRWCERTDKRIDELTRGGHPVTRWKLCTKTTTPFLERYVDSILGCVARLDQALLYRPWDRHEMEKRAKNQLAEARANSGKPENVALRRAPDKIEAYSGPEYKIGSKDEAVYEDVRSANEEIGDLVVEE